MATAYSMFRPENAIALPPSRAWQARTVEAIKQAIREGHMRIVVQSPTGAGKTGLAAMLFAGAISKGKRPLFTVPDITLVEQTLESFERVGIRDVGVIQGRHERTDWQAQVQIASIQTLIKRELPEVDLIIQDECHVIFEKFVELMDGDRWKDKVIIGLSATPWARGMGLHWTKLIIGATIKDLIAEGILCGFQGYGPDQDVDLSSVRIVKGEFDEGQSSAIMRDAKIVADVVEQWRKHGSVPRIFMFCVDRAHAREQQAKFEEAGVPFGYIDGTMSIDERKPIFQAFREGRITGISSVGCLSRGVDEDVHCIIDVAPTNSEMAFVQKIGRGLRNPGGGDKRLLILDHAGNANRLGMVTDIHHEELDSRPPGDRTKALSGNTGKMPRKCPGCNAIVSYSEAKCCVCGTVLKAPSATRHAPGELTEYGVNMENLQGPAENRQEWYSGFLYLAAQFGRSEGWAAHRFREKFHEWPNGLTRTQAVPTKEVRQYDKYLRIKWAKSKSKEGACAPSDGLP